MQEPKKEWQKPTLIVIGRGRPEESVLLACKNGKDNQAGWTYADPTPKRCDKGGVNNGDCLVNANT